MRAAALASLILAFYASGPSPAPAAEGGCSASCDKTAATCVDACETKFPTTPSPRITCKLECAKTRDACESGCSKK